MSIPLVSPFLALPAEIRNHVYGYALNWPDLRAVLRVRYEEFRRTAQHWTPSDNPWVEFPKPHLSTPTILLANRQIYQEARAIPIKKTLVMDLTPLH